MKYICLFIILLTTSTCFAQIKTTQVDKSGIPKSVTYKGYIINAVKFTDSEGDRLVIATETGAIDSKNIDDGRDAELYAYSYTVKDGNKVLSWQVHDFVKYCQLDLEAKYVPGTFGVTDLDKNGKAEVWLMYKTSCTGDVSAGEMKIIMHEGTKKYAIRGQNKVKVGANTFDGGKFTFDEAFKTGPAAFKNYAQTLWTKNIWGPKN
jgi:hypothetical protein